MVEKKEEGNNGLESVIGFRGKTIFTHDSVEIMRNPLDVQTNSWWQSLNSEWKNGSNYTMLYKQRNTRLKQS